MCDLGIFLELLDKMVLSDEKAMLLMMGEVKVRLQDRLPSFLVNRRIDIKVQQAIDEAQAAKIEAESAKEAAEAAKKERDDLAALVQTVIVPLEDERGEKYYTIAQFMAALQIRMGRTYGWRTDYIKAALACPEAHDCKSEDIQKWQRTQRVPTWAYEQISLLEFVKRPGQGGPPWTTQDHDFLVELYSANPRDSNANFAEKCSERFKRTITESAIKGAVDRLRKSGRISGLRPKR